MRKSLLLAVLAVFLVAIPALSGCASSPPSYKWRMATAWTTDNLLYTESALAIADRVARLSNGRLTLEVQPAGKLSGAFEVFDTVSKGTVESGHSWPGYARTIEPSFELFSSIPDMMTQQEWLVWLYGPSQGIELWRELYAKYNAIPFPAALAGPEFGFFTNKPVRTIADFKGMRLRTPAMGADVLKELGAIPVVTPQDAIRATLTKGEIDGFEFSVPAIDWNLGFDTKVAPYVTLPSWHQPSGMYEVIVNRDVWNKLPDDLRGIFEAACKEVAMVDFVGRVDGVNAEYLKRYEQGGVTVVVMDTD